MGRLVDAAIVQAIADANLSEEDAVKVQWVLAHALTAGQNAPTSGLTPYQQALKNSAAAERRCIAELFFECCEGDPHCYDNDGSPLTREQVYLALLTGETGEITERSCSSETLLRNEYEKYIEEIAGNYAEAAGDDGWGGFAARDIARKLHPYEEWLRRYHP